MIIQNKISISVCLTVHGHSIYLEKQLESIFLQSQKIDELIVFEDFSLKKSPKRFIESECYNKDINLKYKSSKKNLGPAESFRNAILASSGDIIILSDHDDIWAKDRVYNSLESHRANDFVIVNGYKFKTDTDLKSKKKIKLNRIYNNQEVKLIPLLFKNNIIGATISFKGDVARSIASKISFYPMHDWVLIISFLILRKKIDFINRDLIFYRRHDSTYTGIKKNSIFKMFKYRVFIIYSLIKIIIFNKILSVK